MNKSPKETPSSSTKSMLSLSRHYNATQLRLDTWERLKAATVRLADTPDIEEDAIVQESIIIDCFDILKPIESYWAFPGKDMLARLQNNFKRREFQMLANAITMIVRMLVGESYRTLAPQARWDRVFSGQSMTMTDDQSNQRSNQHYFDVLFVETMTSAEEQQLRARLMQMSETDEDDLFMYDIVVAQSFEDALTAVLFNYTIQSCVIRFNFPYRSIFQLDVFDHLTADLQYLDVNHDGLMDAGPTLAALIKQLRPELDLYLVMDSGVEETASEVFRQFRRVFYRVEDYLELHLSIIRGIRERYETPFFDALKDYSQRPTGVFHAMPISRGNSVFRSGWIKELGKFYGRNLFLAETSATTGGLDSLLQPIGVIKKAQQAAARAFGAKQTFFVTNGTSTANKIVLQALVQPDDIVLIDRDCHKSHHYGLVLAGACPVYLDSYPVSQYSMYGAVPLREIKHQLLKLKRSGLLGRVKMILLTNCTFDGLVYNVKQFMQEILAIKPDIIFLWDEAWFAFAVCTPTYRQRTGMQAARDLQERYRSEAYRQQYKDYLKALKKLDPNDDSVLLDHPLMPDPDAVKIRVYTTQSTHKKLSSFRQGSMIHIYDEAFSSSVEMPFHEAYMTHTSTSPSYPIISSLDMARRQVEFEGYELVQKSVETAMTIRARITAHPLLQKHFSILTIQDMIPKAYRISGIEQYYDQTAGWSRMEDAWSHDEFVLDPTHITLYIGKTGINGDTFKGKYLMDQYGIQVNKTSRNTVLFMTNIGTTRSAVAYLMGVLLKIARQLDQEREVYTDLERVLFNNRVHSLTVDLPPLPDFSAFHPAFKPYGQAEAGDLRKAYFMAYDESACEYMRLDGTIQDAISSGRIVVSAAFVIPYPPGFPVLAPGQVISQDILNFLKALDVKEIHGYAPEIGLHVFTAAAIDQLKNVHKLESEKDGLNGNGQAREEGQVEKKQTRRIKG